MIGFAALLIFLSLVLSGYALSTWVRQRDEAQETRARRLASMTGTTPILVDSALLKDQRLSSIQQLNELLGQISLIAPVVRMVRQARLNRRVGEVLLYIPLLGCVGFLVTVLIGGNRLLGLIVGALCACIPLLVVQRIRRKRAQLFGEQLPDALDLIRAALQAGHGLASAMNVVADEFPDPIAQELRDVTRKFVSACPSVMLCITWSSALTTPTFPSWWWGCWSRRRLAATLQRCSITSATPSANASSFCARRACSRPRAGFQAQS